MRLVLLALLLLPLTWARPAAAATADPAALCADAGTLSRAWEDFAGYVGKLRQGGLSDAELAYIEDSVEERHGPLIAFARPLTKDDKPELKAFGEPLAAEAAALRKHHGQALVDHLDGAFDRIAETLDQVLAYCYQIQEGEDDGR